MPKYLIFVIGISAGVASMFGISYLNQKESSTAVVTPLDLPADAGAGVDVSMAPLSVVDESLGTSAEPDVEPESGNEVGLADAAALVQRIEDAEFRIAALELELAEVQGQQFQSGGIPTDDEQAELLSSVFEPATVAEIQTIRNDAQLQRLELRDRAIREGWINTDRFREESRALRSGSRLRETLGDEGYDQLLVAEGRNNRVRIETVIENSAADLSGIETGDLILRYADDRIFEFRDLRNGTTAGERDESVAIQVSRNGEVIDLVIPRGPMGVTLAGVTEQPLP